MPKIQKIKQCIREQNYRITVHAQQEADEDNLDKEDIETIILTGKITKKFTHDPRGIRYLITGKSRDGENACIVCRFLEIGKLSIITIYAKGR
jgi:hypothetical protein